LGLFTFWAHFSRNTAAGGARWPPVSAANLQKQQPNPNKRALSAVHRGRPQSIGLPPGWPNEPVGQWKFGKPDMRQQWPIIINQDDLLDQFALLRLRDGSILRPNGGKGAGR